MGADQNPPGVRIVRIFLASPSADTQKARAAAVKVIDAIIRDQQYGGRLRIELWRWDDPARKVICERGHNAQNDILKQIGSPGDCDLVIDIFAHTMGGTLDDVPPFGRPPGEDRLWFCTEWEIEQGLQSWSARRQNPAGGRTRSVWIFQDRRPLPDMPLTKHQQALQESLRVCDYIMRSNQPGSPMKEGWNEFRTLKALGETLQQCVRQWLHDEFLSTADEVIAAGEPQPRLSPAAEVLTPLQQTTLDRLLADPDFRLDEDEAQALRQQLPAGLRGHLLHRWAEWCTGEGGRLDRRFVNLTLLVDQGREFQGERYARRGSYDRLADLLQQHADVHAWVLVGDPGSGKSTVLQHHELSCARVALQGLTGGGVTGAAPDPAGRPEICVWHRLSEYGFGSPPPDEWLARRWPAELPPPAELGRQVRLRYLLDGLNEIQAPGRAEQLQAVERWTTWAAAHSRQAGALAPIFSVRTLDQSPMSLGTQFEVRQIVLEPWRPEQIERFCAVTLGEGNALWPAIQREAALLELCRLPFNLAAQCRLFQTVGRAVTDRAELLGGLFWQMLAKRLGDAPLKVPGLLGDDDRRHIVSGRWVETLCALPEGEGCLVPWLDDTAQRLQRQGRQVSVPRQTLLAGLDTPPGATGWATPLQWLAAVRSLKLIGDGQGDKFSTTPPLRFAHQLWQEFFAARGIRHWAALSPGRLPDLRPPALLSLDETLQQLGTQEPLPGPDPSHWEEPVKLAVQLVPDPLPWLRVLQPQNLALAGRAAVACRRQLEQVHGRAVLDDLRQALLTRSRDPEVDVRQRIEAGLVLGELGDPRYEERQGPHGRYLWPRQWVKVPGGTYRIGDDSSDQPDEKPETEVTLELFEMAFAPVTNAEYRCFIEAGGYGDEQWWEGETARRWLKEGVRNEVEITYWSTELAAVREDVEGWIAARPQLTEANREWWRERATETEARHAELLDAWYGARRFELPQEWSNPQFNAPTQPVVGICQFEAKAYAKWLQAQSGKAVRLPSEAEWEAAARGREGRRWSWGEEAPGRWQMNADPAHLRRTSPVGVFAGADTPQGLVDLSGNVWEWTSSLYTDRLDEPGFNKDETEGLARRVVRGGSWDFTIVICRASYRNRGSPDGRLNYLGIRLVVSCPIQGTEP